MVSYSVEIRPNAEAQLRSIPFPFRRQINQRIFKLKLEPRPAEAIQRNDGSWRLPYLARNILYDIDDHGGMIIIHAII